MQLSHLEVQGFLNRREVLEIVFHSDINIVTGYNGAGKTNLLKLLWYVISGNIRPLLEEITFRNLTLTTTLYTVRIVKESENTCSGWIETDDMRMELEDVYDDDRDLIEDARDRFNEELQSYGSSLFFPTFRRIEGGFTISDGKRRPSLGLLASAGRSRGELQKGIVEVSQRLSNSEHAFVTSVSTIDVAELLLRRYTEMSETASGYQSAMTQEIINDIREFNRHRTGKDIVDENEASSVLDAIAEKIEQTDIRRERAMAPLRAVQDLVTRIFHHKAIEMNQRVSFGDAADAISSDLLSAGEKQMLSFICYNAFFDQRPIFIDEPELSLHVDWQRTLFPTLESQEKRNQFIIATHSPFIYGKYPEKEIALVNSRGDEGADAQPFDGV